MGHVAHAHVCLAVPHVLECVLLACYVFVVLWFSFGTISVGPFNRSPPNFTHRTHLSGRTF